MLTSSTKRENRDFHLRKRDARAELLFCQSTPIAILPFSSTRERLKRSFKWPYRGRVHASFTNAFGFIFSGEFIEIGRIIDSEHEESKHVQG